MTGVGAMYTDNGSWAVGALQKAYLNDDKVRFTGVLGYADLNLKFYGVGSGAGDQGISIPIEQSGTFAMVEGLGQVANGTFIGLRYRLLDVDTRLGGQEIPALGVTVPSSPASQHERPARAGGAIRHAGQRVEPGARHLRIPLGGIRARRVGERFRLP